MLGIIPQWTVGVGVIIVLITAASALLRLLPPDRASRSTPPEPLGDALTAVQRRLGELDAMQTRLAELEERLDFAERLLAQQREVERVAPPRS
jgi:hypothetical protein